MIEPSPDNITMKILEKLEDKEYSPTDLAEEMGTGYHSLGNYMKPLRDCGAVERRHEGRKSIHSITDKGEKLLETMRKEVEIREKRKKMTS